MAIGELFKQNYLDNLNEEDLFILTTALVYEPRKGEKRAKLNKRIKTLKRDLNKFIRNINKIERSFKVRPLSKRFFFHLGEASRMWFQGTSFSNMHKFCSIDEGEIVRYFRMSIQVLREIHSSGTISDSLKQKVANCLRKVNRDVVDAEKQLRQEI